MAPQLPQCSLKPGRSKKSGQRKSLIMTWFGKNLLKYGLTVFTGLDIQDIAPDTIPGLGVGQHLDAVVGEFLQASELHLLLDGCDVLHFTPLWQRVSERKIFKQLTEQLSVTASQQPTSIWEDGPKHDSITLQYAMQCHSGRFGPRDHCLVGCYGDGSHILRWLTGYWRQREREKEWKKRPDKLSQTQSNLISFYV